MVRKYITKKSIGEFTSPPKLPSHYEDEILDAFANYSLDKDMTQDELPSYFQDLKIPKVFMVGNKRLHPEELTIEDTGIVEFDKLMAKSYHLLLFRDNRELIEDTWNALLRALGQPRKATINFADLKELEKELKLGISDTLLLDMVAVGSEGKGLDVNMVDFAYILGKLGHLSNGG